MNTTHLMDLLGTTGDYAVACARRHGPDLLDAASWNRVAQLIDQRMTADARSPGERRHWLLALAVAAACGQLQPIIRMRPGDRDVGQLMAQQLWAIVATIQGESAGLSGLRPRRPRAPFPSDRLPEDEELWGLIVGPGLQVVFWWPRWCACTSSAKPLREVLACLWVRDLEYGALGRLASALYIDRIAGGRHITGTLTPEQSAWIQGPAVRRIITDLVRDLARR